MPCLEIWHTSPQLFFLQYFVSEFLIIFFFVQKLVIVGCREMGQNRHAGVFYSTNLKFKKNLEHCIVYQRQVLLPYLPCWWCSTPKYRTQTFVHRFRLAFWSIKSFVTSECESRLVGRSPCYANILKSFGFFFSQSFRTGMLFFSGGIYFADLHSVLTHGSFPIFFFTKSQKSQKLSKSQLKGKGYRLKFSLATSCSMCVFKDESEHYWPADLQ